MSDPHGGPVGQDAAEPGALDATTGSDDAGHDAHAADVSEHGHGESLGPIDWAAWGAGVLGLLVGLGTAAAFAIATNRLG